MKKILILVVLFLLQSCGEDKSLEEISEEVYESQEGVMQQEGIQEINWSDEIVFSECQKVGDDHFDVNIKEVQDALNKHNENVDVYPDVIAGYCTDKNREKFIFTGDGEMAGVGRFDKTIGVIERPVVQYHIFRELNPGNYFRIWHGRDTSLKEYYSDFRKGQTSNFQFGKENNGKVSFHDKGILLTGFQDGVGSIFSGSERAIKEFKNKKYCEEGITSGGKGSVCYVDAYYSYDYINNVIIEDKICSFYIDDDGKHKSLEPCREFEYTKNGYNFISGMKGIELFQSVDKDISIIDVDLKYAGVSFGGLVQDENFYKKYLAKEMEEFTNRPDNIFGVVNGAFFLDVADEERTGLSFPIKSEGIKMYRDSELFESKKVKETFMDNENPKRTIVITQDGSAKILEGYSEEYLNNPEYLELSVAFTPEVTARRDDKIGRSYIGLKCENNICNNIIFFVADNKTQADMDKIIADYGVERKNIIMMDGGPSAQFSYVGEERTFYGKWKVPQFNIIYEK